MISSAIGLVFGEATTKQLNSFIKMNTESSKEQPANEWVQRLIGFAAQCENEGILGLAQATVDQTTSLTFQVASAVTSTACHIVSEAGRAVMHHSQFDEEKEEMDLAPLQHCAQEVTRESTHEKEAPFLIKIAFQFTDIVLATISPSLSSKHASIPPAYSNGTELRLLNDADIASTTSCSLNNEELFYDANSCAVDECSVHSVYFDANATVSTCSASDETNDTGSFEKSSSEETDESQSFVIESIPNMLYATTRPSPTYFLDVSDALLSKLDNDIDVTLMKCDNNVGECFALNSDASNEVYVQAVLDALIRHSLDLLADNNLYIKWQPDDTTKNLLQQNTLTSYDDDVQWMQLLEKQVLKWTTQVDGTPMLKTRGIVNMTPKQLNNLLLDCSKVKQYNKCSLGKKDLCAFNLLSGGEAKIVEHAMQIPIVGGKVETLSLTHSRSLPDDSAGFVIVSCSVKKELNDTVGNPCFSISSLRSIAGTEKTELTTLTSISLPVPKFLMHRVAFYGADDFFCNLRKITS